MESKPDTLKRFIRDAELCELLGGISETTLWRFRQRGIVPPPVKIGYLNCTHEDVVKKITAGFLADLAGEVD